MNEKEWVHVMAKLLRKRLRMKGIIIKTGLPLTYGYEISAYRENPVAKPVKYQTDLAIVEETDNDSWVPRVIIEAKLSSISTHSAITYSQKAQSHKTVHPYLRYGVMLGNCGDKPLQGRLFRHGTGFDFMISFRGFQPRDSELKPFLKIIRDEVHASQTMEKIIYESRRADRDHYTILRRRLQLL